MKKLINSKIAIIALMMLFSLFNTSCKKDIETKDEKQIEESASVKSVLNSLRVGPSQNQNNQNPTQTQNALNQYLCFEFSYPVSIIYNDGTTQSLADDTEFANAIAGQTNSHYIINFVYPFDVVLANGNTQTINNDTEFSDLVNSCQTTNPNAPLPTDAYCFDFVYPVTLIYNDGSTLVVNDDNEFDNACFSGNASHYIDHIAYPFDVVDINGQNQTIDNAVAFQALVDSCNGPVVDFAYLPSSDTFAGCIELVYPVTLVYSDGTTATVNSDQEYDAALSGSTSNHFVYDFQYDFSVIQNGNLMVVHDFYDFVYLYSTCQGGYTSTLNFTFNYPVDVILSDGSTVTVNNDAEMDTIMEATPNTPPYFVDFVYPFTVVQNGVTITIHNRTEYDNL
jgi:hypothetical protein